MQGISVVIPYYNDSSVFRRTLESILNQTLLPKEVIIVDDCSNDSQILKEIVSSFNVPFEILLYRNTENKNGAYSRNFGIRKSKYDYIALLDADDYWGSYHLEESIFLLENFDCDFIYSNIVKDYNNGELIKIKVTNHEILHNKNDILFKQPPQTNSFFFKRDKLDLLNISFDERLRRHQDWKFLLDVLNSDLNVRYLDSYNTFYCESIKEFSIRVNYDSIFLFWSENEDKFTRYNVYKVYLKFLVDVYFYEGPEKVNLYIEKYNIYKSIKRLMGFIMMICGGEKRRFKFFIKALYYFLFSPKLILKIMKLKFYMNK